MAIIQSGDLNFVNKVYKKYLTKISIILNKLHKVNYPKEYWRIVVGPWLLEIITNIYYIGKYENQNKNHFKKKGYLTHRDVPNDYIDHTNKIFIKKKNWKFKFNNEIFNTKLKSEKIKHKINGIKSNFFYDNIVQKIPYKKKISFYIQKFFNILIKNNNSLYWHSYFSTYEIIKDSIQNKSLNIFDQYNFVIPRFNYIKQFRTWNLDGKDKFEKKLNIILPKVCPKTYLEGFKYLQKEQKRLFPNKIKKITSAVSLIGDDFFKILNAEKKLIGSKINFVQHGGSMHIDLPIVHCWQVSDLVSTWGKANWMKEYNKYKKKVKVKVIGYKKGKQTSKKIKDKDYFAFLSVNTISCSVVKIAKIMTTQEEYNLYLQNIINFLNLVPKEIRKKIVIGVKEEPYGVNTAKKILKLKFPEMDSYINCGGQLAKISGLHISTYFGTMELETQEKKIPTIFLEADPCCLHHGPTGKNIVSKLKTNGYYFTNPYKAAKSLLKIHENTKKFKLDFFKNASVKKLIKLYLNK